MCQSNENVISSDVFLVQPEHSDCRSEREACGDHAQCVYQVGETKKGESTETNFYDNNFIYYYSLSLFPITILVLSLLTVLLLTVLHLQYMCVL